MSFKIENTLSAIPIYNAEKIQGTRVNSKISNTLTNGDIMVWNSITGEWEGETNQISNSSFVSQVIFYVDEVNQIQLPSITINYTKIGNRCTLSIPTVIYNNEGVESGYFILSNIPDDILGFDWTYIPIRILNGNPNIGYINYSSSSPNIFYVYGDITAGSFNVENVGWESFSVSYEINN